MSVKRVLFLDMDGTIRKGFAELQKFVNKPEDVILYDEVNDILQKYQDAGYLVLGISNQLGISLGFASSEQVYATMERTRELTSYRINEVYLSVKDDIFRKPKYGLIVLALVDQNLLDVNLADCLMVGDRAEDKGCADAAGIPFQWAHEWRKNPIILGDKVGKTQTEDSAVGGIENSSPKV